MEKVPPRGETRSLAESSISQAPSMLCRPWEAGAETKVRGAGLWALEGEAIDIDLKATVGTGTAWSATLALRQTSAFSSALRGVVVRRKLEAALRGT